MKNHNSRIINDKSLITESTTSKVDRWRSGINASLLESNFSHSQAEHLHWTVEAHHFDVFICGRLQSTAQSLINFPHKYDNLNDHFILMAVVTGGIEGKAGRLDINLSPGDVVILDVLQPIKMNLIESRLGNYIDVLYMAIPRALLFEIDNSCELHGKIINQKDFLSKMIASNMASLLSYSANFSDGEVNKVARPIIDFVISAIRSSHAPIQPIMMDTKLHIITRVCDFVQENLRVAALGSELICQKFGLSRSSLYRLFEPFGGIMAHIRKKRVVAATRMLLKPQYRQWKVAEIAYYWQFEPAAFNRLFISTYGLTPNQARREHHELWALENMNESQVVWLSSL